MVLLKTAHAGTCSLSNPIIQGKLKEEERHEMIKSAPWTILIKITAYRLTRHVHPTKTYECKASTAQMVELCKN